MSEMLTVLKALTLSTDYLSKKGVDEARANAELMLSDILKCKRLDLYLRFDKPLSEYEKVKYREYLKRRGEREPLQYILGHTEFYGMEFKVTPSVLIPRPETELLVEKIIDENKNKSNLRILDIGAGSGNISIALAKYLVNPKITSIDISANALNIAKENAISNSVEEYIDFVEFDIMNSNIDKLGEFDIIVSNPPYVSMNNMNNLEPELKEHEPVEALTDNSDGYSFYYRISGIAKQLLPNGGKIYFEISENQGEKVSQIMVENGIQNIIILKDYQDLERVVSGELK